MTNKTSPCTCLQPGFLTPPCTHLPDPMQISPPQMHPSPSFITPPSPQHSPQHSSQSLHTLPPIVPPEQKRTYRRRLMAEVKLRTVTNTLNAVNLGAVEFLVMLLQTEDKGLHKYRSNTYKANCNRIHNLLDLIWDDPNGRVHIENWMHQGHALDLVCKEVSDGMEASKQGFLMLLKEVSLGYLKSWSVKEAVTEAELPNMWIRVLEAATQSAANTKLPTLVSSHHTVSNHCSIVVGSQCCKHSSSSNSVPQSHEDATWYGPICMGFRSVSSAA